MHKTTLTHGKVYREQRFRIPSPAERALGLWVDRIGSSVDGASRRAPALRILGQYAAVHLLSGSGQFVSRATGARAVAAPDVMLLLPEEPAAYWPEESWETLWIVWQGEDADRLAGAGCLRPERPVVADPLGVTRGAHDALARILQREDLDAVLHRKRIVLELVHGLYRSSAAQRRPVDARIAGAIDVVAGEAGEAGPISEAAARVHMSPTHFRRLFRAHTGLSPAQYRMTRRIARAKEMLSAGTPMKVVAARTGFGDVFHFMRAFKRVVGVTPGRFAAIERGMDGGGAG
jgi:AraC-like DNA-binding protein